MPKIVTFNGKRIVEPGAYSRIRGGESNPPEVASFGKVLIIDTGSMAGFGFGYGVNAEQTLNKSDAIQEFSLLTDFQNSVAGGLMWDVSKYLFKPTKDSTFKGVDSVFLVRACTTTKATMSYTWTGGGANGGVFEVDIKAVEGLSANGVENATSSRIQQGFGMRMTAGTIDSAKFIVEFYRGAFRGVDYAGRPFNNIKAEVSVPELLMRSPEFDNINQLITWAENDRAFNSWFSLGVNNAAAGTGEVDSDDLTSSTGNELAAGGTETYNPADLSDVFDIIDELDYDYILLDDYEADVTSANNLLILGHVKADSQFNRILVVGGGADESAFAASLTAAGVYDDSLVHVVHSRVKDFTTNVVAGEIIYPTIYHAAAFLGRIAGAEPQDPATFKELNFDAPVHEMSKSQRGTALLQGVVHQRKVKDLGWVINQDVNTLQKNDLLVYEEGTSPEGSIMRIANNLNKMLSVGITKTFTGGTLNNASPEDLATYIRGQLGQKIATKTEDNLLLSFQNVSVSIVGADYEIQYGFTPNGPANRFFITGFMYSPKL